MARRGATAKQNKQVNFAPAIKRWWWVPVLCLTVVIAWDWVSNDERFPINHVRINQDLQRLALNDVQGVVAPVINGGFFSVDLQEVSDTLETMPWVHTAALRRQWPDTLLIHIQEQQPVAIWNTSSLLNEWGDAFTPNAIPDELDLLILSGEQGQEKELLNFSSRIDRQLNQSGLSVVRVEENARLAMKLELSNGMEVLLGRDQHEKRLSRLVGILPTLMATNDESVQRVDMRYPHGLAVVFIPQAERNDTVEG